jgi:transposase-like protein
MKHREDEEQEEREETDAGGRWQTDQVLETETDVTCPYCGETVSISLDPGGGMAQEYVEDCQVCCRPWQVHVYYARGGAVEVTIDASAE